MCHPKSGILRFLACDTPSSYDTLIFRSELSNYYVETRVLDFPVCRFPVVSSKKSTQRVTDSHIFYE